MIGEHRMLGTLGQQADQELEDLELERAGHELAIVPLQERAVAASRRVMQLESDLERVQSKHELARHGYQLASNELGTHRQRIREITRRIAWIENVEKNREE